MDNNVMPGGAVVRFAGRGAQSCMRPALEKTAPVDGAPVLIEIFEIASAGVTWRRLTVAVTVVPGNVTTAPSPLALSAGVTPGESFVNPAATAFPAQEFISGSAAASSPEFGDRAEVQLEPNTKGVPVVVPVTAVDDVPVGTATPGAAKPSNAKPEAAIATPTVRLAVRPLIVALRNPAIARVSHECCTGLSHPS
ncbi:MAG: hypothetical protein WBD02_04140 [Acidimicrobiia bacterium]